MLVHRRKTPNDNDGGTPITPAVPAIVVAGVIASTVVASVASARAPIPYPPESRLLAQLERPVLASVHDGGGVVVLRRDDTSYAAATLAWGFVRRSVALRYAALCLFGLTIVKVFFVDLASVKTAYRMLSLLVLGVVLLLVGLLYQKASRRPVAAREP